MDESDFMQNLEKEANELRTKNHNLNMSLASSSYQGQEDANLLEYQLDTAQMLASLEHFLRGEYLKQDDKGNENWVFPTKKVRLKNGKIVKVKDKSLILFNDYGVNSIMSIIGNYVDRNTILSFYDEMRINEILADLGDELSNFVFCNYETMGMDTEFKKSRFQLTVITIIHTIESSYRRALKGKTLVDLNSSKIFTQSDHMGNVPKIQSKRFNLFKPGTW